MLKRCKWNVITWLLTLIIASSFAGNVVTTLAQTEQKVVSEKETKGKLSSSQSIGKKPKVTETPKVTVTPTPMPTEIPVTEKFPEVINKTNVRMNATCFTSEKEATRYFLEMVLNNYYQFGIFAEDLSMLHTKEEYMKLCPVILDMKIESVTEYKNGYYLDIKNVKTHQIDAEEMYAIYTGDTSFLNETEKKAYKKLLSISEELKLEGKSDIDKILAIHDYLVLNIAYDEDAYRNPKTNESAHYVEGALLNQLAVCSGYASTFQLLLLLEGIPCEYVNTDTHAWNLVQVDEKWYHVDVTWDDPIPDKEGRVLYTHFMMTDSEIAQLDSHGNWNCECGKEKEHNCNDTTYRLYPYKDYICTTEKEAVKVIKAQKDKDEIVIVYPSKNSLTEKDLLSLVRKNLSFEGTFYYYPSENLGSSYKVLRVINN